MKEVKICVWANIRNIPKIPINLVPLDAYYERVYLVGDDFNADNFNPHEWMQRFEADLATDSPEILWDEGEIILSVV